MSKGDIEGEMIYRWSQKFAGEVGSTIRRIDVGFVSTTLPPSLSSQEQKTGYTAQANRRGGRRATLDCSEWMGMSGRTPERFSRASRV